MNFGGSALQISFDIPDDKVNNAKKRLQQLAKEHTLDIISEAEKVEKMFHEAGASADITDNIIFQASRRNKTEKKKDVKLIIFRVLAEILLFAAGCMFIPERFIDSNNKLNLMYLVVFLIIVTIALICVITSHFLGGE